MDIIVLAGGVSDERDVSMSSGSQIANALLNRGHRALLMDLADDTVDYQSFEEGYIKNKKEKYHFDIKEIPPLKKADLQINSNLIRVCQSADIVFLALHGGIGENGKLQAFFDIYGIQYTGSDYSSSLLAMDKITSKQLFQFHGFDTPNGQIIEQMDGLKDSLNYPVVVKPSDNGSSIGINIVENAEAFEEAVKKSFEYAISSKVMVEEKIVGREFSVGILDDHPLPVIELIPTEGVYDYKHKYQDDLTIEITPANIPSEWTERMQILALKVHKALGLAVYSRIDFIVDEVTQIPYIIEANSLPGMTPNSLLPKEAKAVGISYEELCDQIVQISMRKFK